MNGTYDVSELSAELQVNLLFAAQTCSKRTFLLTRVTLVPVDTSRLPWGVFPPNFTQGPPIQRNERVRRISRAVSRSRTMRLSCESAVLALTRSSSTVVDGVFVDPDGSCNISTTENLLGHGERIEARQHIDDCDAERRSWPVKRRAVWTPKKSVLPLSLDRVVHFRTI